MMSMARVLRDLVGRRGAGGVQIEGNGADIVEAELGQCLFEDLDVHVPYLGNPRCQVKRGAARPGPPAVPGHRSDGVAGEAVEDVGLGDEQRVEAPVAHHTHDDDRARRR